MLLLLFAACTAPAYARDEPKHPSVDPRHVDGSSLGGTIDLSSTWLAKQGDDPRYADPELDDSQWTVVTQGQPLSSYGWKNVDQLWLRTHVTIPRGSSNLALSIRYFGGSRQVFVNGVEAGSSTAFPQGGISIPNQTAQLYPVPDAAVASGELTIAIRARIRRASDFGYGALNSRTSILLGNAAALSDESSLYSFRSFTSNYANLSLELLLLLITIALALALRDEREYAALAVYLAADVARNMDVLWRFIHNTQYSSIYIVFSLTTEVLLTIALIEFVRIVLSVRRSRWIAGYEWLVVFSSFTAGAFLSFRLVFSSGGISNVFVIVANIMYQLTFLPFNAGLPLLALWIGWKRRNATALLLFIPLLLRAAWEYFSFAHFLLYRFNIASRESIPPPPISGFYVEWIEITYFLFSVTLLVFLVLRTIRIARSRAEVAAEIEAAQTMQRVLLARSSQATSGFAVESVYLPAAEVGGDFFLVSPGSDGSLMAVVGDVSGKGLIAAMRVSMILGVLRREDSRDPAQVLNRLNDALLSQSEMGFTTACCVRMERDGTYRLANAGHIPPYIDGHEIETAPALPLGLAPGQDYTETAGTLHADQRLVLMSDGVVEARSPKGDLLGFDRLTSLTRMPASEIAGVAQRFGQDDDITVLTIARAA